MNIDTLIWFLETFSNIENLSVTENEQDGGKNL